ncbi:MAG: alpha/beta hydrolase, partial [Hyphomicrobiales bacterium]|nr:alpha/beta hydrolase [Hyphomicrobiales bacterium]
AATADDIAAVIEALDLKRPVLVGWSYGGAVIADFLRHHGTAKIAGIGLVAAVTKLGKPAGPYLGPDFAALIRDFFSEDYETGVAAMAALTRLCFAVEPVPDDFYRMLGYAVAVPPHVRSGLFRRTLDSDDLLPGLDCPAFLCHGTADRVILPAMSEHHKALIPQSTLSLHRGIGHAPFIENPARFNRELAQFIRDANN